MTVKEIAELLLKMESEADRKLALELIKGLSPTEIVQWPPYRYPWAYPYTTTTYPDTTIYTTTTGDTGVTTTTATGSYANGNAAKFDPNGGNVFYTVGAVSGSEVPKAK